MPSADATIQMIEEEIAPVVTQVEQLEYELDSRVESLQTSFDGQCANIHDSITALDTSIEDGFVKNEELASHLDETYWRNDKVDKRFEAHANQAEATAGDVELLGDHMAEVWEYTGSIYDDLAANYTTSSELSAILQQHEMMQDAKYEMQHHRMRSVAELALKSHKALEKLMASNKELRIDLDVARHDLDVAEIVRSSLIHSVDKLDAAKLRQRTRKKRTGTVVTDCRPTRRSSRLKPKNLAPAMDSVSEMTQICHDNETSV